MRTLLVEAVHNVTRLDGSFRKTYQQRCHRMAKGVAKAAAARKLAVRLYWMLRTNTAYPEIGLHETSSADPPGQSVTADSIETLIGRSRLPYETGGSHGRIMAEV